MRVGLGGSVYFVQGMHFAQSKMHFDLIYTNKVGSIGL